MSAATVLRMCCSRVERKRRLIVMTMLDAVFASLMSCFLPNSSSAGGVAPLRLGCPTRAFALDELRNLVSAMTEAVGWPIHWPKPDAEPDAATAALPADTGAERASC